MERFTHRLIVLTRKNNPLHIRDNQNKSYTENNGLLICICYFHWKMCYMFNTDSKLHMLNKIHIFWCKIHPCTKYMSFYHLPLDMSDNSEFCFSYKLDTLVNRLYWGMDKSLEYSNKFIVLLNSILYCIQNKSCYK